MLKLITSKLFPFLNSVILQISWSLLLVDLLGTSVIFAQALIYKAKQKQKGSKRMLLPSAEGQEGGNWIVIDSGKLEVHALDEKVRAYYNLERLQSTDASNQDHGVGQDQDLDKAFLKVRPKNNSKRRSSTTA